MLNLLQRRYSNFKYGWKYLGTAKLNNGDEWNWNQNSLWNKIIRCDCGPQALLETTYHFLCQIQTIKLYCNIVQGELFLGSQLKSQFILFPHTPTHDVAYCVDVWCNTYKLIHSVGIIQKRTIRINIINQQFYRYLQTFTELFTVQIIYLSFIYYNYLQIYNRNTNLNYSIILQHLPVNLKDLGINNEGKFLSYQINEFNQDIKLSEQLIYTKYSLTLTNC